MAKSKIIIIGGGASGIMAAIVSARNGAKVTIIERKPKIGRKILATGNGRCNLTNLYANKSHFHSETENIYEEIINKFDINSTMKFFNDLGITTIEKDLGKVYPRSEQANSVVNALLYELNRLKVNVVCNSDVENIQLDKNIKVKTSDKIYYCNKLIIATGGKSCPDLGSNGSGYKLAKMLGHTVIEPFPSLVQLKTDYQYLKQLQGTKIWGTVKILDDENNIYRKEKGEVLFTDYGVSGPPILQISRYGSKNLLRNKSTYITIDLVSEYENIDTILINRFEKAPNKTIQESFVGFINNRLIIPIIKTANIDINKKVANITKEERISIGNTLKNLKMKVTGTNQWNQSQVTAGGVDTREIDSNTLESKICKNIYLCGEIIDIDGDCGGYNLQWAWSSGAVAGLSASK
jgi:predicted Rossmann fold flavoprotein